MKTFLFFFLSFFCVRPKYRPGRMKKYYSGKILFCGTVLRRYVSQNIVAISGTLRLNRFTLLYVHYLIDRFSQLLRCEVVSHFINAWDIRCLLLETTSSTCWFPVSRDFYVRTFVKFTFANNYRGNVWKVARKRKSRNSLNFTFNLNTLQTSCLASTFFTWLKFTCVKYVFVSDVFIRVSLYLTITHSTCSTSCL